MKKSNYGNNALNFITTEKPQQKFTELLTEQETGFTNGSKDIKQVIQNGI